ncbi:hypothetical protein [Arthrobacter sp. H14]|uniref:hypothetical protein n=1 Tax=Arthrobacter sp. H14 TaxID=1312959 RepID=UPI00047990CB|nr:hypothetical protein [Arthrobacter sp. H14]
MSKSKDGKSEGGRHVAGRGKDSTGGDEAKSEGFGENRYDQLTGPQSEDLEHPRGTAEEAGNDVDKDAQAEGVEDPRSSEVHGRHPEQG